MSATPYNANIPTHVAPADERLLRLKNLSVAMVIPTSSAASICTSVLARLLLSQAPTAQESQPSSKPLWACCPASRAKPISASST